VERWETRRREGNGGREEREAGGNVFLCVLRAFHALCAFCVSRRPPARPRDLSGFTVLLVAALVLCGLTTSAAPRRVHATGAVGLVVRHSDGRTLYAYIPLTSDRTTGADVLMRAGFPLNLQASSSLGAAVCAIDGEGCAAPKEDCFCKSYGDPSYYWHYYTHAANGAWRSASVGAGNRVLHDGDVDGWSWTAGDSGLPTVTLNEIAALVLAPATPPVIFPPMPTPVSVPVMPATPVIRIMATSLPPLTMPALPVTPATVLTIGVETATSAASATAATVAPSATIAVATPTLPVATSVPAFAPTLVPATTDAPRSTMGDTQPRAVIVGANGTVTPVGVAPPPPPGSGRRAFTAFAAVALVMLLLLAVVPLGARRRRRP